MDNKLNTMLKGIITDTSDPLGLDRVQVYIPNLHGRYNQSMVGYGTNKYPWAQTTVSSSCTKASSKLAVDDIVWLTFEDGDVNLPIYVGLVGVTSSMRILPSSARLKYNVYKTGSSRLSLDYSGSNQYHSPLYPETVSSIYRYNGGSLVSMSKSVIYKDNSISDIKSKPINSNNTIETISIGLDGWSGNNARNILGLIKSSNPDMIRDIESKYSMSLGIDKDWSKFNVSEGTDFYSMLSEVLSSEDSSNIQNSIVEGNINSNILEVQNMGIYEPKTVIYFCSMASDNLEEAKKIANECIDQVNRMYIEQGVDKDNIDVLSIIHNIAISGKYLIGSYINSNIDKRKDVFDTIKDMETLGMFMTGSNDNIVEVPLVIYYPLDYRYKITTDFGYHIRIRSLNNNEYIYHNTVDITGRDIFGKPILCGIEGRILSISEDNINGKYVEVSDDRYIIRYSHMSSVNINLDQDRRCDEGTVLGYVGFTGDTSGSCLSISLYDIEKKSYIDPKPYFISKEDE